MNKKINNWIDGTEKEPFNQKWLEKVNPHNAQIDSYLADSDPNDVDEAVNAAEKSFNEWANLTPVHRGDILFNFVDCIFQFYIVRITKGCSGIQTTKDII